MTCNTNYCDYNNCCEEVDFEINVAISTNDEDEILIYDDCGRFVPISFEDIDDVIVKLINYSNYFNIKHNIDDNQRMNPNYLNDINNKIMTMEPDDLESEAECVDGTQMEFDFSNQTL